MPFIPQVMTGLMMAKAASKMMGGSKLLPEISSLSSAICSYLSIAPVVVSTNIVTGPGAGTYTGKVVGVVPSVMSSLMMLKATSKGIMGRDTKRLFDTVSFGVCQTMLTAVFAQGVVIGGGPGVGHGKITNLVSSVLQGIILLNVSARILGGSKARDIAGAMAFGICSHIMTSGTILTTCIGAFAPPPVGPIPILAAPGPGRLI
ncbi:MAG: hypothetical protein IMZ64_00575 [Bacteroidetes bacterium]|nr:hypothetical protein [Bacteroidota bacterium]